jgi:hypothetical protein
MAMKLKWDITGKGDEAWGSDFQTYEGPTPPKGSYVAKVKRMTLGHIKKEGENKGKPRISVLLEIVSGAGANGLDDEKYQYRGAPVWDGLNIIKAQTGRVNGFLHALTDGSDAEKRAVETAFWPPNGPKADKVARRDGGPPDVHITHIGKYNIGSPDGECLVRITTKMGKDLDQNPRAEIGSYLPYTGPGKAAYAQNGATVDDDVVDDDDEVFEAGIVEDDSVVDAEVVDDDEPPF